MGQSPYTRHITSGRLALALAAATSAHVFLKDIHHDSPPANPHSVADVVDSVRPGTVYVAVKGPKLPDGSTAAGSSGSGFVIDGRNGYIITNNHVINSAAENPGSTLEVMLTNGKKLRAKIVGRDTVADLAVLKVEAPTALPQVRFGDSSAVRVGESVIAIGNPFGLISTTTTGIVSAMNRAVTGAGPYEDIIQSDAAINSGNSGGALFNMAGEVIGVNTSIISPNGAGSVGLSFSLPSNRVAKLASRMIAQGDIQHGWLGVSMSEVTEESAQKAGLKEARGVLIMDTADKGPAQSAGLKAGDIMLKANGEDIYGTQNLTRIVIDSPPGSKLDVVYWRDGAEHTMSVKLGNYKTLQENIRKEAEAEKEKEKEKKAPVPEAPAPAP